MIKAKLEKKPDKHPNEVWCLELNGSIARQDFRLTPIIDYKTIVNKIVEAQTNRLVIDLSTAQRFDSEAVRILLTLYKEMTEQNIHLALQNPTPHLSRVLRIMQFDRIFEIGYDEPAAPE